MNTVLKGRIVLTTIFRPFWRLKFWNVWYANVSNLKKRFVTSSGVENHLTLYNTSVRSNKSNVNSSSFTTETNLFLFCKRDFLELYWGSSISTNPSLDALECGVEHWTLLFSSFLYLFLLFHLYLVGRRNEKMDVKVVFLGKWFPSISDAILFFFLSWFQKVKFQDAFYAPPVVVVSPRLGYNNNKSRFSGSAPCNLVTAWVEVRNI